MRNAYIWIHRNDRFRFWYQNRPISSTPSWLPLLSWADNWLSQVTGYASHHCSIYFTLYIAEKQEESSPLFTLQTSFPLRLGISPSNFELRLYIIAAALIVLILARLRFRSLFTVSLPFGFGSARFCVFPLACRHRVSRETLKFILSHLHLLGRVTHPLAPSVAIRSSVLYILIIFIDIYTASVSP